MLSKAFTKGTQNLMKVASRGVYTDATRPHVFINKHTRVLVQGMTGKHVSSIRIFKFDLDFFRELSTLNNPSITEPTLSEESIKERQEPSISAFQFTETSPRPRTPPEPMPLLFMFHHHLPPMLFWRQLRLRWNSWFASLRVSLLLI